MSGAGPRLTLYSRRQCHLCHQMQARLDAVLAGLPFELEVVDIDLSGALLIRYNEIVPVLQHGNLELARYRLDEEAALRLREFVRDYRPH